MAKIAVFGASGFAGGHITREALRRGHRVTAVARDISRIAVDHEAVDIRAGSIHDAALVNDVASDTDLMVVAVPAREIDGRKLIDSVPGVTAVAAHHRTRLAFVGGAASLKVADDGPRLLDTPEFPDEFKPEATGHVAVLERLQEDKSGADWFYLSPAAQFGAAAGVEPVGSYRLGADVLVTDEHGGSKISGQDYACALVDEIETPKHRRARFTAAH